MEVRELKRRLDELEKSQNASVEGLLSQLRRLAASKSVLFSKDHAMDTLLQLKILAKELKHQKASYFSAVLEALREKMSASEDQFKKYLLALLGDKEQEKVLDTIAKVDKASKASRDSPGPSSGSGLRVLRARRRYARLDGARCFNCNRVGHYQNRCPERRLSDERRSKQPQGSQK